jgi:hypothetical protein
MMLYETLTQRCMDENEIYQFSFNESYVREGKRSFLDQSLNYNTQFPLKCNCNKSRKNNNSLLFLFQ